MMNNGKGKKNGRLICDNGCVGGNDTTWIRTRIKDGKISHKDVQVSYVYIDKDQAKIDEIKINEKGHFESSWRDGFFTERLDLI